VNSFACRGGRRHPGFPEGDALRGASSERRPRPVRSVCSGSSLRTNAPVTADARRAPRRGTTSACATKRMHPSPAREIVAGGLRGRVLHSVLRPVHVNPHYALRGNSRRWGVGVGITDGQARASGRNHHWGRHRRTERGSPRIIAPARESRGAEEKEEGHGLRPCEDHGEPGFGCPHVVNAVAEVSRRRRASNKLGKRAPKRAVRVE
jgi:hypothetical protein